MSVRAPDILRRRLVGLALCYLLALQAFVAALDTARAVAADPAVICHGLGSSSSPDQAPARLPCAHCALAAAGVALLPAPPALAVLTRWPAGTLEPPAAAAAPNKPPERAGLARAPPRLA